MIPSTAYCTAQPQKIPKINWGNPITNGLVFCAWPVGSQCIDLVTKVYGTRSGTLNEKIMGKNNGAVIGHSLVDRARVITGNDGTGFDGFTWPGSATLRGGNMVLTGTLLFLGGSTTSNDGELLAMMANADSVATGDGYGLTIDSNYALGAGNIIKTNYGAGLGGTAASALGANFENQLHFFGYSFTGNGADGLWMYDGITVAWTGGSTSHGTTSSNNRKATVFTLGGGGATDSGILALGMMWTRALGTHEYAALYRNPWQLLESESKTLWINAAAAAGGITGPLIGGSHLLTNGPLINGRLAA